MTIIAFDGKSLAADRLADDNGTKKLTTKIKRLSNGDIAAGSGVSWQLALLQKWYLEGQDPEKWPPRQYPETEWPSRMIIATKGEILTYELGPIPNKLENAYYAWGSGQDYAMGALAMGATAKRAVEIAGELSTTCGLGVDVFDLELHAKLEVV
jgi:hypothetical protein